MTLNQVIFLRSSYYICVMNVNKSIPGVLLGIMLAAADYHVDWKAALLLMAATVFLHFYSVTSKTVTGQSRIMPGVFLALTVLSGLAMLHFSFGTIFMMEPLLLMVLGYMMIRAVRHTSFVSRGKGILYVFLLFGILSVYGSYYVCSHSFGSWPLLFPALSIGLLSVAVRTEESQKTLRLVMNVSGFAAMTVYSCLRMFDPWHFLFVLSLPLFFIRKTSGWAVSAFALLSGLGFLVYLV